MLYHMLEYMTYTVSPIFGTIFYEHHNDDKDDPYDQNEDNDDGSSCSAVV